LTLVYLFGIIDTLVKNYSEIDVSSNLKLPKFKRGDSFKLICTYRVAGELEPLDDYEIRSQIRTSKGDILVADLEAEVSNTSIGEFILTPTVASTSAWPLGEHVMDIEIVDPSGNTKSSDTFILPVEKDISR
jgi:hypothetical protein